MKRCGKQAQLALDEGEVPVGCVVVDPATSSIVCRGRNATNVTKNVRPVSCVRWICNEAVVAQATRHAEFVAADELRAKLVASGAPVPAHIFTGLEL